MALSNREIKFVHTYNPPNVVDPVEAVEDFHRVREYASRHPRHGRTRAGSALEMNPSRIRGWLNGTSKPDCVRGLDSARERGWLSIDGDDPRYPALAILTAGIFACGGIAMNWVPAWAPETDQGKELIVKALDVLTGGYTVRHESEVGKPTEFLPENSPSVFGRVLVAYGVPQGNKNEGTVERLPNWLLQSSLDVRRSAVDIFVLERGTFFESKDTVQIQSRNRQRAYREDLANLIQSVAEATVTANTNVVLSAEAVRNLGFGRGEIASGDEE